MHKRVSWAVKVSTGIAIQVYTKNIWWLGFPLPGCHRMNISLLRLPVFSSLKEMHCWLSKSLKVLCHHIEDIIQEGFRSSPCYLASLFPLSCQKGLFLGQYSPFLISRLPVLPICLMAPSATTRYQFQAKLKWRVSWFKQIDFCLQSSMGL